MSSSSVSDLSDLPGHEKKLAAANDGIEKRADITPGSGTKATAEHAEHAEREHLQSQNGAYRATGNVDNLLAPLSRAELFAHVDEFIREYQLEDIGDIIRRGAVAAQRPADYEDDPDLLPEDKEALRFEKEHKWRHPLQMYLTIILCSIGACVQGWDQTGIAGANLSMPAYFGYPTDSTSPDYNRNNWIVGLIGGAPYLTAFGLAAWMTDPINHYIGRRGTLFLAAIFCILAPIGSAFTQSIWQLFACRLLLGMGIGFKETIAPVLAAENAPTPIRGALVMMWQMWTAFGIFLGYTANLILWKIHKIAWRLMLASAFIPAVPLILLVYMVPESPRWYIKKRRVRPAWNSLSKLRRAPVLAGRDLYYVYIQIVEEDAAIGGTSYVKRLYQLFYKNRLRQATLASFVVMIAQQMCGINIMSFYSSSIFAQLGTQGQAMWSSFGFGLVNFVFAFPAFWTIDTFGRRALLLWTFPNMFWTLLAAGLSDLSSNRTARRALVALFVYLFTAFYSPGEGPVPFTYSAEVFPLSHREVGMAWAVTINNLFAFLLSLTFFRLRAAMDPPSRPDLATGAFGFYAGLNLLAFVWIFLWVPETKQLSLEELDFVFSVPTSYFMKFQIKQAIPFFVRRYIKRDKTAVLPEVWREYRKEHGELNLLPQADDK